MAKEVLVEIVIGKDGKARAEVVNGDGPECMDALNLLRDVGGLVTEKIVPKDKSLEEQQAARQGKQQGVGS